MQKSVSQLLAKLSNMPGPPGQEELVANLISDEISDYCTRISLDPLNNLIAEVGTKKDYSVGVLAHMDEVALIVRSIAENGLIFFEKFGSINDHVLLGREVNVLAKKDVLVPGVIGVKSQHLVGSAKKEITHKEMWLDIGISSRKGVLDLGIDIGSGIVFNTQYKELQDGSILGKALDDRVGCLVLIETIKQLSNKLKNISLYGMFTSQEEIGAKGASVVAYNTRPSLIITLDTVPLQDPTNISPYDVGLGKGPVIRLIDWHPGTKLGMVTHKKISERLISVAKERSIPYQKDILFSTYLDSSRAHLTAGGIAGGSICFPRRYSHNPAEVCNLNDIKNGIDLLVAFIESLDFSFLMLNETLVK